MVKHWNNCLSERNGGWEVVRVSQQRQTILFVVFDFLIQRASHSCRQFSPSHRCCIRKPTRCSPCLSHSSRGSVVGTAPFPFSCTFSCCEITLVSLRKSTCSLPKGNHFQPIVACRTQQIQKLWFQRACFIDERSKKGCKLWCGSFCRVRCNVNQNSGTKFPAFPMVQKLSENLLVQSCLDFLKQKCNNSQEALVD